MVSVNYRGGGIALPFSWPHGRYKFPNLSHSSLDVDSLETFNNTGYARKSQIVLLALLSNFSQSSFDILVGCVLVVCVLLDCVPVECVPVDCAPVGCVPGSKMIHYSLSTRRSSILSFHSSKFLPLNFSISILEEIVIPLSTLKSPLQNLPLNLGLSQTQDKCDLSRPIQTLSNKGVPLKPKMSCDTTCKF
jgi:hypothetical protein